MILFLTMYIAIYFLMHGYVFFHAYSSLRYGRKIVYLTALFSLFMVVSPIIVRLAERSGFETVPRLLAYAGYTWMGFLFLFIAVAGFFDFFAIGKWCLLKLRGKPADMTTGYRRRRFFTQLVIVLAIYCYGLYEANNINTMHVTIASPKISQQMGKMRVVQISDVHLGLIVRERRLAKILAKVKESQPDLLVSTGDLVDGQLNNVAEVVKLFDQVKPHYGKLAVTGNHEFYAGLAKSLKISSDAGFLMLRNEAININGNAFIGVDDQTSERFGDETGRKEKELLRRQKRNTFTVLLKHRPVVDNDSVGLFDIQLSGHTHSGQIFPFTVFPWISYGFRSGINKLSYGYLYISNGSGTWGPPIRFVAPPEVTVIDLVPGG